MHGNCLLLEKWIKEYVFVKICNKVHSRIRNMECGFGQYTIHKTRVVKNVKRVLKMAVLYALARSPRTSEENVSEKSPIHYQNLLMV